MERMKRIPEPMLEIADLSVRFAGKQVLESVNLDLYPGELVMAIGPSGSGKTTLLRAVNRLNEAYPHCNTRGQVRIRLADRWWDIYAPSTPLAELRLRVGMVFQHPNPLPFSIYKNVALPLRISLGMNPKETLLRVQRALEAVQLWSEVKDRLHDSALTLSGGQQQRLCLARVLALEPALLLLDEPTASLDFKATRHIEALFQTLKQRYPILAVTHNPGQMRRLADRVMVLQDGRCVAAMSRPEIEDPEHSRRVMEAFF
ncbi:phosphate ABC transporter ATP-binding protein [Desulfatitalea alkaliphila]|uniref:ATP-binding cassette domain-containing protein n=1 Tax=Desulfatitalea alkaliphila TaxID=2929485 RepID=A0AA41R4R0_9BACT|nr:ATP-binding cassette domain-containing protein [Desulfatitalea alkaliphila]MCJ8499253.1 ATP-binding cassette domain-containing protein [Desulfatitalea alkaliphila]